MPCFLWWKQQGLAAHKDEARIEEHELALRERMRNDYGIGRFCAVGQLGCAVGPDLPRPVAVTVPDLPALVFETEIGVAGPAAMATFTRR